MVEELTEWNKLYEERESKLRGLYSKRESTYVRGVVLSALERITQIAEQLPDQNSRLSDLLHNSTQELMSPKELASRFRANIKRLREQRKWSQKYVANALNVSSISVTRWENGRFEPKLAYVFKLAELYGVLVKNLFD